MTAPVGAVVWFEVDDKALIQLCQKASDGLERFVDTVAQDLVKTATLESASRHVTWHAETSAVVADQWFAHFLARGTEAHGPEEAQRMVFKIDQDVIFAEFVAGITADPFHERAAATEESRIDYLLNQLVVEV